MSDLDLMRPKKMTVLQAGTESGIRWAICRAPLYNAVNGYAQLPYGHPWRDLSLQSEDYDKGPDVHGGITYGPDSDGWIGFDFLHAGDFWPGQETFGGRRYDGDVTRTESDVQVEAISLAVQIAAVSA